MYIFKNHKVLKTVQTNGIYIKKVKSNIYIFKNHKVLKTVQNLFITNIVAF